MNLSEKLLERNWIPDAAIRLHIKKLLKLRLKQEENSDINEFIQQMRSAPIALNTKQANDQHYEVPAEFYQRVLGKNLKYSCAYFENLSDPLNTAEDTMLEMTCERARLQDGQEILELGCGWGSLTLYMAQKYPNSKILGVSNSNSQRIFIEAQCKARNLKNVQIVTCDMNQFSADQKFDRVVSVEMFEHMRNVEALLGRIDSWLKKDGMLFVHIFTHKKFAYLFEDKDETDWMARHFFTGGMMPSHDLYKKLSTPLVVEQEWAVSGIHYSLTAERWLENMDANEKQIRELFAKTYGHENVTKWWVRWRVFFMSCAELWHFGNGKEWQVSHYLFRKGFM